MAKKTKDLSDINEEKKQEKATAKKVVSTKKATTSKKALVEVVSSVVKKATKKKSTVKSSKSRKTVASKKTTALKKVSLTRNIATKKTTYTRSKSKAIKDTEFQPEYYDLPYTYNKTVVKILAQTPKLLFVYWEISDDDRKNYMRTYGERFFEVTKPILIVYNNTMHYSFEVDINDFANSWYININDSNCNYSVELGRKPIFFANTSSETYIPYYIYVSSSNKMDAPNNHVMYDFSKEFIQFRNVKTGEIINKNIKQFKFVTNHGIMTINELYNSLYPNENFEYENFVGNPSSGFTSSR